MAEMIESLQKTSKQRLKPKLPFLPVTSHIPSVIDWFHDPNLKPYAAFFFSFCRKRQVVASGQQVQVWHNIIFPWMDETPILMFCAKWRFNKYYCLIILFDSQRFVFQTIFHIRDEMINWKFLSVTLFRLKTLPVKLNELNCNRVLSSNRKP